jgi:hypothetical protein
MDDGPPNDFDIGHELTDFGHLDLALCVSSSLPTTFKLFDVAFNNISVISWRSVLLVEEAGGLGEKPAANH